MMLYLDVIGGKKRQRSIILDAMDFCLPRLFSNRMINNLSVEIRLEKLQHVFGHCLWEDDNVRPRDFIIQVNKDINDENIVKTLFHETTHMKQFAYNQLKERYKDGHKLFWFDEDHSTTPYENQPWETEASEYEESLYNIFINR